MHQEYFNHPLRISATVQLLTIDEASDGQRLDNFLIKTCKGVPKSHLYKAIRSGQVRVNKSRAKQETRLCVGDIVRIPPFRMNPTSQAKTQWVPPRTDFEIIYEDDYLLVINKPSGIAVHGGSGVSFGVIEQLRASRPDAKFLELVHRLDKDTSGLLMIAKKRATLVKLQDFMRQSVGRKQYYALVHGKWQTQEHVKLPLLKFLTPSGERRVKVSSDGKYAHTVITPKQHLASFTLVNCLLKTGRTHQIRVHLVAKGHPIVGDDKYGIDASNAQFAKMGFKRMFLHAHSLDMPHPITGEILHLNAPLPKECEQLLAELKHV